MYSDFRTGTRVSVYDIDDIKDLCQISNDNLIKEGNPNDIFDYENASEEELLYHVIGCDNFCDIIKMETELKCDMNSVYLCTGRMGGFEESRCTHIMDIDVDKYSHSTLEQIFSEINGCQPFEITGQTPGYKDIGYYPDPLPTTLNNDIISREQKFLYENEQDICYCISVVLYNNSNVLIDSMQMRPLF